MILGTPVKNGLTNVRCLGNVRLKLVFKTAKIANVPQMTTRVIVVLILLIPLKHFGYVKLFTNANFTQKVEICQTT